MHVDDAVALMSTTVATDCEQIEQTQKRRVEVVQN